MKLTSVLESLNLWIMYLHFIWSWPFSLLIFFVYLLLHDCINLLCEEEKLLWNKPRNNCIWIFFSILIVFLTSQIIFYPFDDNLSRDFNVLTHHSLISVRVIAVWSQDHKLETYMYLIPNVFILNYFYEKRLKDNTVCMKYKYKKWWKINFILKL